LTTDLELLDPAESLSLKARFAIATSAALAIVVLLAPMLIAIFSFAHSFVGLYD
jgi:hypothetical protein